MATPVLEFFADLGRRLDGRWAAVDRAPAAFPELALEELDSAGAHRAFAWTQILDEIAPHARLPPQPDLAAKFGQPPITLFHAKDFFIDALFWVDATTAVHEHAFSGAFQVLHGSSIHGTYSFAEEQRFDASIARGRLSLEKVELLRQGDARAIRAGARFIHSLFHLDRPSVSLVVRTPGDAVVQKQLEYVRPGVAVEAFYKTPALTRTLQILDLLSSLADPSLEPRARALLARAAPIETYFLLDKMFRITRSAERFAPYLEAARAAHPELVTCLGPFFERRRREAKIISRRAKVHDKDHRFLLALLLNLDDPRELQRLVAERSPGKPPAEQIVEWVGQMAATKLADEPEGLLGMELGEPELLVMRWLLEGGTSDEVLARLSQEYEAEDVLAQTPMVIELCEAFRGSLLFGPLFARSA